MTLSTYTNVPTLQFSIAEMTSTLLLLLLTLVTMLAAATTTVTALAAPPRFSALRGVHVPVRVSTTKGIGDRDGGAGADSNGNTIVVADANDVPSFIYGLAYVVHRYVTPFVSRLSAYKNLT
jgi:hypothetical protein